MLPSEHLQCVRCHIARCLGLGMNHFPALNSLHASPAFKAAFEMFARRLSLALDCASYTDSSDRWIYHTRLFKHRQTCIQHMVLQILWTFRMTLQLVACQDRWGSSISAPSLSRHSSSLDVMRLAIIAWRGLKGFICIYATLKPRGFQGPEDCDPTLTTLLSWPVKHVLPACLAGFYSIHINQVVHGVRAWLMQKSHHESYQTT